jgi:hypothetical protein
MKRISIDGASVQNNPLGETGGISRRVSTGTFKFKVPDEDEGDMDFKKWIGSPHEPYYHHRLFVLYSDSPEQADEKFLQMLTSQSEGIGIVAALYVTIAFAGFFITPQDFFKDGVEADEDQVLTAMKHLYMVAFTLGLVFSVLAMLTATYKYIAIQRIPSGLLAKFISENGSHSFLGNPIAMMTITNYSLLVGAGVHIYLSFGPSYAMYLPGGLLLFIVLQSFVWKKWLFGSFDYLCRVHNECKATGKFD